MSIVEKLAYAEFHYYRMRAMYRYNVISDEMKEIRKKMRHLAGQWQLKPEDVWKAADALADKLLEEKLKPVYDYYGYQW